MKKSIKGFCFDRKRTGPEIERKVRKDSASIGPIASELSKDQKEEQKTRSGLEKNKGKCFETQENEEKTSGMRNSYSYSDFFEEKPNSNQQETQMENKDWTGETCQMRKQAPMDVGGFLSAKKNQFAKMSQELAQKASLRSFSDLKNQRDSPFLASKDTSKGKLTFSLFSRERENNEFLESMKLKLKDLVGSNNSLGIEPFGPRTREKAKSSSNISKFWTKSPKGNGDSNNLTFSSKNGKRKLTNESLRTDEGGGSHSDWKDVKKIQLGENIYKRNKEQKSKEPNTPFLVSGHPFRAEIEFRNIKNRTKRSTLNNWRYSQTEEIERDPAKISQNEEVPNDQDDRWRRTSTSFAEDQKSSKFERGGSLLIEENQTINTEDGGAFRTNRDSGHNSGERVKTMGNSPGNSFCDLSRLSPKAGKTIFGVLETPSTPQNGYHRQHFFRNSINKPKDIQGSQLLNTSKSSYLSPLKNGKMGNQVKPVRVFPENDSTPNPKWSHSENHK